MSNPPILSTVPDLVRQLDSSFGALLVATGQYAMQPAREVRVGVLTLELLAAPQLLADVWLAPEDVGRLVEHLAPRRVVRRGAWDVMFATPWTLAWTDDEAPFWLVDPKGVVVEHDGATLRLRGDVVLGVSAVREVEAHVTADWLSREVRLHRDDGEVLTIARVCDEFALVDPTYDAMRLACDAAWASSLTRALASSLGVAARIDPLL